MNDVLTSNAQIRIAYIYAIGFFLTLGTLIFYGKGIDEFGKSVLLTMLGYLGALVQQQSSYFFARQRPDTPAANTERKITDRTVAVLPPQGPTPSPADSAAPAQAAADAAPKPTAGGDDARKDTSTQTPHS
jgi:hypothetical protein